MTSLSTVASQSTPQTDPDVDWTLTTDQMIFILQYHNAIETAYDSEDMAFTRELAASNEYKAVFGDMSWDEAYDRYEEMLLEAKNANSSMAS